MMPAGLWVRVAANFTDTVGEKLNQGGQGNLGLHLWQNHSSPARERQWLLVMYTCRDVMEIYSEFKLQECGKLVWDWLFSNG